MRRYSKLPLLLSIIAVFISLYVILHNNKEGVGGASGAETTRPAKATESTFDRVMRTGTIRCGYLPWSVHVIKDANTGALSGIFYDYINKVGESLDFKVDWSEEVTVENWPIGLDTGRYDMVCSSVVPIASRAKISDFTIPIMYNPMNLYVRANDKRFDGNLKAVNKPDVTFVGFDGTSSAALTRDLFPDARLVSLPLSVNQTDIFLDVIGKKADITLADRTTAQKFIAANPGQLREVSGTGPVSVFASAIPMKIGEDRFRRMIDNATRDLFNRGEIDRIIDKYEPAKGAYLRIRKPYKGTE